MLYYSIKRGSLFLVILFFLDGLAWNIFYVILQFNYRIT